MKTIREIIKSIGGVHEVARVTGVRPVSVRNWCGDGYIPGKHHQKVIELGEEKNIKLDSLDLDPNIF